MNKEFEFLKIISKTLSDSTYLGNDCAYLDEYKIAISSDSLVEDVHFSLSYMSPYEIAKKSMLVNISDILSSGAKPKYAQINLSGKFDEKFIRHFYEGINETAKKFNLKITGGDLTKSEKIMINICILGDFNNRNISSRKNAKENYIVAVCGEFGSSAKGLDCLKNGEKENYFINYHKNPKLYPEISEKIATTAKHPYAMMDSSDGLIDCLYQISIKSNLKLKIDYDLIPKKINEKDFVLFGGEDYALVLCLSEEDFKNIPELTKIGYCEKGEGVFINEKKIKYKGFKHFD